MSDENRSPAFQFYPDKWQSHTRRLSDEAHRVFHEIMCWMWQQSPDYCSIEDSHEAISCMLAMPVDKVRRAMEEIQNKHAPLFKVEEGRLVLNGLRKERNKQELRSEKARDSISKRWKNARRADEYERITSESKTKYFLSPSSSPSSSPITSTKKDNTLSPQAAPVPQFLFEQKGFSDELWHDWMAQRKKKKASNSDRAIRILTRKLEERPDQAVKAIETCIEAGWTSFEWDWIDKRAGTGGPGYLSIFN